MACLWTEQGNQLQEEERFKPRIWIKTSTTNVVTHVGTVQHVINTLVQISQYVLLWYRGKGVSFFTATHLLPFFFLHMCYYSRFGWYKTFPLSVHFQSKQGITRCRTFCSPFWQFSSDFLLFLSCYSSILEACSSVQSHKYHPISLRVVSWYTGEQQINIILEA